ncbi:DGQHR domain-containing protein [Sphingobacterium sp.]|uniref:DGQHR domain-containing protein n=1 Tax=Sphingobacterium sp. TaxID=341027 RepID=UPI0028A1B357|nr:DGQHR domain-containing protein [Sphingobacterium sp.]
MSKNNLYALKVKQWLSSWEEVNWENNNLRRRPLNNDMLMFSISAKQLKKLSGVYKRSSNNRESSAKDFGIQRKHDPERSKIIREYIFNGYPWSELSVQKRNSGKFDDLKKPGWLPTAIVLNILIGDDLRNNKSVSPNDLITIEKVDDKLSKICLPNDSDEKDYEPESLPPIEIIDGQHRLWAFENEFDEDYEVPVIAFQGMGLSWQAYLFYTINISPKKINRSLAFDLYPLLRNEEWLEKFEGHSIYKETRAQEIVDLLNSHKESPWYNWIDMLGDNDGGLKKVSQSAWIRTLTSTLIKSFDSKKIGGLYGAPLGQDRIMLPWSKEEQAAVIIYFGICLSKGIKENNYEWISELRDEFPLLSNKGNLFDQEDYNKKEPALYSRDSLLNQDQGIRVILHLLNDFLFINYDNLKLYEFYLEYAEGSDVDIISEAISKIKNIEIGQYLRTLSKEIIKYDWRSFNSKSISKDNNSQLKQKKAGFRGSGGYKVLREDVLTFLSKENSTISEDAKLILDAI